MIEYALNYICDYDALTNSFSLNPSKIRKSVALALLTVKGDFHLREFISAHKHAIELSLPLEINNS